MLHLFCQFCESKLNPCGLIVLTSSSGSNCVLNEHDHFDQYNPYTIPSEIMTCCSYGYQVWSIKFKSLLTYCVKNNSYYIKSWRERFWPIWLICNAIGENAILQLSFMFGEYPIELSSWWAHLALIMSSMSMKMLTNMAHMQYHRR